MSRRASIATNNAIRVVLAALLSAVASCAYTARDIYMYDHEIVLENRTDERVTCTLKTQGGVEESSVGRGSVKSILYYKLMSGKTENVQVKVSSETGLKKNYIVTLDPNKTLKFGELWRIYYIHHTNDS